MAGLHWWKYIMKENNLVSFVKSTWKMSTSWYHLANNLENMSDSFGLGVYMNYFRHATYIFTNFAKAAINRAKRI